MKFWMFLVVAGLMVSCGGKEKEPADGVPGYESVLTGKEEKVLKEVIDYCLNFAEMMKGRGMRLVGKDNLFTTREEFEGVEFRRWPLVVFDERAFLEEPVEGRFLECVKEDDGEMLFGGRKDDRLVVLVEVFNSMGWKGGIIPEGDAVLEQCRECLPGLVKGVDKGSFRFLKYRNHLYLMYNTGGKTFFRKSCDGEEISVADFMENVLKRVREEREREREIMEKMGEIRKARAAGKE